MVCPYVVPRVWRRIAPSVMNIGICRDIQGKKSAAALVYFQFCNFLRSRYEGESNKNVKSAIKIRTTARLSFTFQRWYSWFEEWPTGGSTILIQTWNHCVLFAFNKLRDKTYLRFTCDSPSYIGGVGFYHKLVITHDFVISYPFVIIGHTPLRSEVNKDRLLSVHPNGCARQVRDLSSIVASDQIWMINICRYSNFVSFFCTRAQSMSVHMRIDLL